MTKQDAYEKIGKLDAQRIIRIHDVSTKYGKTHSQGVRDQATLEMIANTISRMVKKQEKPERIAARISELITKHHPFWDGNHRTAFEVAQFIMTMFDFKIEVDESEATQFMRDIDSKNLSGQVIENWIKGKIKSRS